MLSNLLLFIINHSPLLYLTQSLWRDEAFSVLVAQPGGLSTINITASDYNPPLYYLLLHFWMGIFGKSEISIRLLSFLFFIGFLIIVYKFAKVVFKGKLPVVVTLLAFLNPMLIYYGFEARMYSLYAFTTTASMYFFYTTCLPAGRNKWKPYIFFTTLALYTHPFTLFIPFVQGIYLILKKKITLETITKMVIPFILYLPWIFVIIKQFQNSKEMWIYPVNLNLVLSVLGNLFAGYDGTPGFLWNYMKLFSLVLFILFLLALRKKVNRDKNLLFFLWLFVPLTIVLGVSFLKPIFVNRYVITISVAQIFLISLGLSSLPTKKLRVFATLLIFTISLFLLFYLPSYIKKVNIRQTFTEINTLSTNNDLILARSPLVFFESVYYSKDFAKVFLYNPDKVKLPGYLGTTLIPENKHLVDFPKYPKRAFMVYENGSFEIFSSFAK